MDDGILNFMKTHRITALDSRTKVFTMKHLLERYPAIEADDLLEVHHFKPFTVEHGPSFGGIKDFKRLLLEAFGVGHDLVMGKLGTGFGTARGVAYHGGEIPNDQNRLMSKILKLT